MPLDITRAGKSLGYNFLEAGQCYGLACMGIQACQRDLKSVDDFVNRVKLIHSYEHSISLVNDIKEATLRYKKILKRNNDLRKYTIENLLEENYIDYTEKLLLTMKAFFDGIALYMGRESINDIFAEAIGYPDIQNFNFPNEILNKSNGTEVNLSGLDNGHEFTGILNREDISEILSNNKSKKISYLFSSNDHAFSISCLENNLWLTVDHDNVNVSRTSNNALTLIKSYATNNTSVYNVVTFGLSVKENFLNKINRNFISRYKEYIEEDNFNNPNKLNDDKILIECIYLLFAYGPLNSLKELLIAIFEKKDINESKVANLFSNNPKNGCSGFYHALQEGNVETVKIFLDIILNSKLPEETKTKILKAERVGGISGLYMAMQHGFSSTVNEFTKKILNSNLSENNKVNLLNPLRKNNISGLDITIYDKHMHTAEIYLNNIVNSNLSKKNKMLIINSHASSKQYGLHCALLNNKKEFINKYINIIIDSDLAPRFKNAYFKVRLLSESQEFINILTQYPLRTLDIWIEPLFNILSNINNHLDEHIST